MSTTTATTEITFTAVAELLNERPILRLPADASGQLPSRGQVAVQGSLNGVEFSTVVEPDGLRGHWIGLDEELWNRLGLSPGDEVAATLTPQSRWPEVVVPADMQSAFADAPALAEVWQDLTPMARWEWVRWVKSTKNAATRARRVEVTLSKLESGLRRPCCFDRSSCTDPEVSKSGKLLGQS